MLRRSVIETEIDLNMVGLTAEALGEEFVPATAPELARFLAENARGPQRVIYPCGGRTALHYGYAPAQPGVAVSLSRLTNVVDYPARDMTITVEAGIRLEDLQQQLAKEGQRLPIDIPQANRATLGGCIACNTSGARRYGLGTLRDYVIGISAIDAQGTLFKAGGRVVKNVAGYDLCKVLIGSLGTLGVITQVTLKVKPIPVSERWLWLAFPSFIAIEPAVQKLLMSEARPCAIEMLDATAAAEISAEARTTLPSGSPVLGIAVEGLARETDWQIATLKRELAAVSPLSMLETPAAEVPALWSALSEFQITTEEPLTFQANLLSSRTCEFLDQAAQHGISLQSHVANGIVIGQLPDHITSVSAAAELLTPLRQLARSCGGNLVVLNCSDAWKSELPLFGERESSWKWMASLKRELDPQNLLNRRRFLFD